MIAATETQQNFTYTNDDISDQLSEIGERGEKISARQSTADNHTERIMGDKKPTPTEKTTVEEVEGWLISHEENETVSSSTQRYGSVSVWCK